ncbi:TetR/AcrR family transcriptional regulator [Mycolicibacterium pallens]|uniref:TetR/AcrR family transcriptional regulator n=1 Tax=Mycolicibacterium pallens TaxID=370524 RepID=A0ABX8VGN3_9MYCO|nr:TetR/AcrR family transcriptional regulator [Mycolicibacterium pallens]QYL15136.1 TetR/AcrR family transcriptional regulator [Mycolicibacterium pallens]
MADETIPEALAVLWRDPAPTRRAGGLSRARIVDAAIEMADADGLAALSMAKLAERMGCGTMSLYRHIANKEQLIAFMLSAAPGPPPAPAEGADWRAALDGWAMGLWQVYHRHPWVLAASTAGPPVDPGQLAWLDAGLAALRDTGMAERDKLAGVLAVLHFVRGAAALAIEAPTEGPDYPRLLHGVVDRDRFPALASALEAGAFDDEDEDHGDAFRSGLSQLLDGLSLKL